MSVKLPQSVADVLVNKKIDVTKVVAFVMCDKNEQAVPHTVSLVLTHYDLYRIDVENRKITAEYSVRDISDIVIEDVGENCRIVASLCDKKVLVACFSHTQRANAKGFCRVLKNIINKNNYEEFVPAAEICPKCGCAYADSERKFCPNCSVSGKNLKMMLSLQKKYLPQTLLVTIALAISGAIASILPYLTSGFLYDEILSDMSEFYGGIVFFIALVVALRVLKIAVQALSDIIGCTVTAKIVCDLKRTIFHALNRLPLSYFTSRSTGGLANQVNSDANRIYWFFVEGLPLITVNLVQFICVFIIMLFMNVPLTILTLILFPICVLIIGRASKSLKNMHVRVYSKNRSINSLVADFVSGIRIIKSFGRERSESNRFDRLSGKYASIQKSTSMYSVTVFPLTNLLVYIGTLVVWAVGGIAIIGGSMSITYGALLTFVAYIAMIYEPIYSTVNMVESGVEGVNAMGRLFEVLNAKSDDISSETPIVLENVHGNISFRDVHFSYIRNREILDGISFDIRAGENIGIVGASGAGKSTLVNLLVRLYDVNSGEITVDGVNIRDISLECLHKNIAIVSQEAHLFSGTIRENIAYTFRDATNDQIIRAAAMSGAHDFISKLPNGYETMVGQGYSDLSGGEKQRISIARALLRNPKILIFDEATASMDTQTEMKIQHAIDELCKGRTTITIAHRLSTLRNADKIIVLDKGKIIEMGSPIELIKAKGVYYNYYMSSLESLKEAGIV